MSAGETDSCPTRTHRFIELCEHFLANAATDVVGILGLVALAFSGVGDASLQVLTGAIASIAIGKRYIEGKR